MGFTGKESADDDRGEKKGCAAKSFHRLFFGSLKTLKNDAGVQKP
jgi:hypothetical protein